MKFKYTLDGSEPIIKVLKAVPDTYANGEALVSATAETGGCKSAGDGDGLFCGVVCDTGSSATEIANQTNILAGTQAAGTIEGIKVIVNPMAVYAVEYDQSARITWASSAATAMTFACTVSTGYVSLGGGWAWSYATGEMDYIVSSAEAASVTTLVVVTGTSTANATGILLQPAGGMQGIPIKLTAAATKIDADSLNIGVAGTDALVGIIISNHLTSATYGDETLDPVKHNQKIRYMGAAGNDKARGWAYVSFFKGSVWNDTTMTHL